MRLFDSTVDKSRSFSDLKKYIDDFQIVEEKDASGKIRRSAVYTGIWFVSLEKPGKTRIKLWGSLALAVAMAAVYGWMLTLTHTVSGQYPVIVPLLAGLFPCLYLLMGVFSLPYRGRPMRRDQYMHSFIRASRSAVAVGVCDLIAMAAALICRAVTGDWIYLPEDWKFTIPGIAVPLMALAVIFLLRSVDLTEKTNDAYEKKTITR